MAVTSQRWRRALDLVEGATSDLVMTGTFHHGVLVRLRLTRWPTELNALAAKICKKATTTNAPTSKRGMNGVELDRIGKASLESLVLHYAKESPALFPYTSVRAISEKFANHGGPKFQGPWP